MISTVHSVIQWSEMGFDSGFGYGEVCVVMMMVYVQLRMICFTENDQFYEMKEEKIIKIWTLITTFINI